jgi:DNA-binding MarR family transcriptional regulator
MPHGGVRGALRADASIHSLLDDSRSLFAVAAQSLRYTSADLSLVEYRVVVILATRGPQTLGSLTAFLETSAAPICSRLVVRGLVIHAPSATTPQHVLVTLSTAGRALICDVTRRRRRAIHEQLRELPASSLTSLTNAFRAFAAACDEPVPPASPFH